MAINLNVLGAFMEHRIGCNLNSTSVISMKRTRIESEETQVPQENHVNTISEQAIDIARYSA